MILGATTMASSNAPPCLLSGPPGTIPRGHAVRLATSSPGYDQLCPVRWCISSPRRIVGRRAQQHYRFAAQGVQNCEYLLIRYSAIGLYIHGPVSESAQRSCLGGFDASKHLPVRRDGHHRNMLPVGCPHL